MAVYWTRQKRVEAFQWKYQDTGTPPGWFLELQQEGRVDFAFTETEAPIMLLETDGKFQIAHVGDYVVRCSAKDIRIVNPVKFAKTYERF